KAKVFRKIGILPTILSLGVIIVLASSCDVLESDNDVLAPSVDINDKEIYVLANGESFIDLQSKVQTNQPARLAVTSDPRHGELVDLGQGILQYSPNTGSSNGRDGFEFTVYSSSNEIIKKDSVIIIIENDSTNLPCNIYPVIDYVHSVRPEGVLIDVTANDIICSNTAEVSVYKPESSFPPYYGTAQVQNNKIFYTPGSTFNGVDKIMYKVTASNPTRIAYGMVYITSDSSCSFLISDDLYMYDSLIEGSTVQLPVFQNDSLCQALNQYQVSVKFSPLYGTVSSVSGGFLYNIPDSVGFTYNDHFTYEVCIDATCKTARVDISMAADSVWNCKLLAVPDSIDISNNISGLIFMEVIKNDSICGGLKSFVITSQPVYGTAFINEANNTIGYQRDPLMNKDDALKYKICNGEECSTAAVYIKRTN
ncbi:MAG: hypothetical protein C0490_22325, partial [Marivirga sp.]|nr:hypothetical protein [Marivirga sp.]